MNSPEPRVREQEVEVLVASIDLHGTLSLSGGADGLHPSLCRARCVAPACRSEHVLALIRY
jgi:hypothetical protein